jgi:DNA-directed RNA polymerase subunit L
VRGKTLEFYGDNHDLCNLFTEIIVYYKMRFVEGLSKVNDDLLEYTSAEKFVGAAAYSQDHPKAGLLYYALDASTELVIREVVMADGSGVKQSLDMVRNPDVIGVNLGGVLSEKRLVRSSISTFAETEKSRMLFKSLERLIRSKGRRFGIKGRPYTVLPNAVNLGKSGWRFVITPEALPIMDAKISFE